MTFFSVYCPFFQSLNVGSYAVSNNFFFFLFYNCLLFVCKAACKQQAWTSIVLLVVPSVPMYSSLTLFLYLSLSVVVVIAVVLPFIILEIARLK